MNIKRILSIILTMILLATILSGCGSPTSISGKDGIIGEGKKSPFDSRTEVGKVYDKADDIGEFDVNGTIIEPDNPSKKIEAKAGTLTAGEWKDANDIPFYLNVLNKNDWFKIMETRNIYSNNIVNVSVKYKDKPCFNTKVELLDGNNVIYTGRTDINGTANLFYNINKNQNQNPTAVKVGDKEYKLQKSENEKYYSIAIDAEETGIEVKELDFMLVIDTTGSMGDELEYLKKELTDIIERVSKEGENLSIRISVNFYRDEDDEYIVKYFDFRDSVEECVKIISEQSADGGGDFPEAVHTALDNAITGHQWRENAIKLCYIVLDAPPHTEDERNGVTKSLVNSISAASEKGIRIIPIASSGIDTDTEYLLRSFAIMTGGTYTFLTDDSGVGNSHLEPTVGDYEVEYLNECIIRITSEYCGLTYTPKTEFVKQEQNNQQQ